MELTIDQALQQGVAVHKEGKLQDAERLYRAILESQPLHPDANHNLGVLAVSVNKADAALPLFKTALDANPQIEQFWLSYIDALIKEKQFDDATQVLEQAKQQGLEGEKFDHLSKKLKYPSNIRVKKELLEIQNTSNEKQMVSDKQIKLPKALISNLVALFNKGNFSEVINQGSELIKKFPREALIYNIILGVSEGYKKELNLVGVGYTVDSSNSDFLILNLGFSHSIYFQKPDTIEFETPNNTTLIVKGINKQEVGEVSAKIRSFKKPEPFKGKGIRYKGEYVRSKQGKTVGGGEG